MLGILGKKSLINEGQFFLDNDASYGKNIFMYFMQVYICV
jgi:hypothetical protein